MRFVKIKRLVVCALVAFAFSTIHSGDRARAADQPFPPSNPLAGDPDAIKTGTELYWKFCVGCHGHKADGVSRFGDYAGDLRRFWRGYCNFVVIVLNGRPKKQMPPWGGYLDEDQIASIGAYLETIAEDGANWTGKCTDY